MSFSKVYFKDDPFFNQFDLLFTDLLRTNSVPKSIIDNSERLPYPIDIYATSEACYLEIPIVDAKASDITVQNVGGKLRVKYERSNPVDREGRMYIRQLVARRDFDHLFTVGNKFDLTEASSEYNNGLLTIRVPLSKSAEPRQIEVKTNLQLNS